MALILAFTIYVIILYKRKHKTFEFKDIIEKTINS